jgi:hypothetical protein
MTSCGHDPYSYLREPRPAPGQSFSEREQRRHQTSACVAIIDALKQEGHAEAAEVVRRRFYLPMLRQEPSYCGPPAPNYSDPFDGMD